MIKGSLHCEHDWKSDQVPAHEYYQGNVTGPFVCLLRCMKCGETCAVSGHFDTYEDFPVDGNQFFECYRPTFISPAPQMIHVSRRCPAPVKVEVIAAFTLYWCDLATCLNRIRNALEIVLDEMKIPKTTTAKSKSTTAKSKRKRLNLHDRIEKLRSRRPKLGELCDRMLAVKHLGNAGSHPGIKVKRDDVFDGFDILESVLDAMYSGHAGAIAKAVKQINRRKGPRKAGK